MHQKKSSVYCHKHVTRLRVWKGSCFSIYMDWMHRKNANYEGIDEHQRNQSLKPTFQLMQTSAAPLSSTKISLMLLKHSCFLEEGL